MAVVGGGPAGLMAAETLAAGGVAVSLYEQHRTVGRKLLLAGRGGLNLTHSEPLDAFLARYSPRPEPIEAAICAHPPQAVTEWAAGLEQPTFVGSSGRVFPHTLRATPLLRAWLNRLKDLGVEMVTATRLAAWPTSGPGELVFVGPAGPFTVGVDAVVLALGGASWPRTGSDGWWAEPARGAGVPVTPLEPSNAGVLVEWSPPFAARFAGTPLKNIAVRFDGREVRGEALITGRGLEGGAIYALGESLRARLRDPGSTARIEIDLRPDVSEAQLAAAMQRRRPGDSVSTVLTRGAGLGPVGVGLLREATGNRLPHDRGELAGLIKAVPIYVDGVAEIDRAISTAGGVAFDGLDDRFMLIGHPGVFVAGEMLDWDAPTGGYLLQASLATGVAAARGVLEWLPSRSRAIDPRKDAIEHR